MPSGQENRKNISDALFSTLMPQMDAILDGYGVNDLTITSVGSFIDRHAPSYKSASPKDQVKMLYDFATGADGYDTQYMDEARRVFAEYCASMYSTNNSSSSLSPDKIESALGVSALDAGDYAVYTSQISVKVKSDIANDLGKDFKNGVSELDKDVDAYKNDGTPNGKAKYAEAQKAKTEYVSDYINGELNDTVTKIYGSQYLAMRSQMVAYAYGDNARELDATGDYATYAQSVIQYASLDSGWTDGDKLPTKAEIDAAYEFLQNDETSPYFGMDAFAIRSKCTDKVYETKMTLLEQSTGYDRTTCTDYIIEASKSAPSMGGSGVPDKPAENEKSEAPKPSQTSPVPSTPSQDAPAQSTPSSGGSGNNPKQQETPTKTRIKSEEKTIEQLINEGRYEDVYIQLTNGSKLTKEPDENLYLPKGLKDAMYQYVEVFEVDGGNDHEACDAAAEDFKEEMLKWCGEIGVLDMKATVSTVQYTSTNVKSTSTEIALPVEAKSAAQAYRESEGNHYGKGSQSNDQPKPGQYEQNGNNVDKSDPYLPENIAKRYEEAKDDPRKTAELDYEMANAIMSGKIGNGQARVDALGENYARIQLISVNGAVYDGLKTFQQPGTPAYEEAINSIMADNVVYNAVEEQMKGVKGKSMVQMWHDIENIPEVQQMQGDIMNGRSTVENIKKQLSDEKSQQRGALADYFLGLNGGSEGITGPEV